LLTVAGVAVWYGFQRPDFVLGLFAAAGGAILKALAEAAKTQVAKDMADPEIDRRNKEAARMPAGPIPKGTGVTTGKTIRQPAQTKKSKGRDR
jgi:hypothetical protein